MEKDAYTIIHQLDPSAKLIGPSPSTANQYGVHFLPSFYAAGGAGSQDIVGMHAYLYDGSKFSTSPLGINTTITQLKLLMSKYGISSKPIWFTEGNWGDTNDNVMSSAQKAAYVAQEHVLIWASNAVSRYYWFSWDAPTLRHSLDCVYRNFRLRASPTIASLPGSSAPRIPRIRAAKAPTVPGRAT